MKIEDLFEELKKATAGEDDVFEKSGIINCFNEMKYGFFPLGLGILKQNVNINNATIEEHGVMVLGNDFGTLGYVKDECKCNKKGEGETDISKTINNLCHERVGLDINKTFFTNFYLGVRDNKKYPEATMTHRAIKLKKEYNELCYGFFLKQLKFINPRIVICLGRDVKNALTKTKLFKEWEESHSIKDIYAKGDHVLTIKELGNRKFILIPHPCDLRNFRIEHIERLVNELNSVWNA